MAIPTIAEHNRKARENCKAQCTIRFREPQNGVTYWRCFTCGSLWNMVDGGDPVESSVKVYKPHIRVGISMDGLFANVRK